MKPSVVIEISESSNVTKLAYDHRTHLLAVWYKKTGCYVYADVSHETFDDLKEATSVGSFVATHIKPSHTCLGRVVPFTQRRKTNA